MQPFIRYEVADRLSLSAATCPCGSRLPKIEAIEGRSSDLFWVESEDGRKRFLTGALFHSAIDSLDCVREWQARQASPRHIELQLELLPEKLRHEATCPSRLIQSLHERGLPRNLRIDIVIVPTIRSDIHSGKIRRMAAK